VHVQSQLVLIDVAVSADSIQVHGQLNAIGASDFGAVRIVDSHGPSAPYFESAPAQNVNVNAEAGFYGPSKFRNIEVRAPLTLSGNRMEVLGNLAVVGQEAGVRIDYVRDSLIVHGTAHFAGAKSAEFLRLGTLVLRGDFMQANPDQRSEGSFRPAPELEVILAGKGQNVTFQTPSDPKGTGSYFSRVRVEPDAIVTQKSAVFATSLFEVRAGGAWVADDFSQAKPEERVRLLDVSGAGTELRLEGAVELSRLNVWQGVKLDIRDPGPFKAYTCYDGGAEIVGKPLSCEVVSDIPMFASLDMLRRSSPMTSFALALVPAPARRHE
jgi:hypothetical protein